jgi:hypothetical protein
MSDLPSQRRNSRRAPRLVAGLSAGFSLAILVLALRSFGGPADEVSRKDYGIGGFKPPPRWELLPRDRPSYPQLLATAMRGQGAERAVITLTAKRLPTGTSLQQFAQEVLGLRGRPQLQNLRTQLQPAFGWWGGQRVLVDATIAAAGENKKPQAMRQLLFMNPPFGYVLTLIAPQDQAGARHRDLDDTAQNLLPLSTTQPPDLAPPQPPPLDGGAAGAAGTAAPGPR